MTTPRRTACSTPGCMRPKRPGAGNRYCQVCRDEATERRRLGAIEAAAAWREQHPERKKAAARRYYERTADRQREKARVWHRANPARVRARRKALQELRLPRVSRYGLSIADYDALLALQGGGCAICGRTENGKRHNFDVDHDHETGAVRGLLCNRCNRLLSNALDDAAILHAAIDYLSRSRVEAVA